MIQYGHHFFVLNFQILSLYGNCFYTNSIICVLILWLYKTFVDIQPTSLDPNQLKWLALYHQPFVFCLHYPYKLTSVNYSKENTRSGGIVLGLSNCLYTLSANFNHVFISLNSTWYSVHIWYRLHLPWAKRTPDINGTLGTNVDHLLTLTFNLGQWKAGPWYFTFLERKKRQENNQSTL